VIMPFYRQHFDALSDTQKDTFIRLLACSDLQLFSWFFNRGMATDPQLQQMVDYIQKNIENSQINLSLQKKIELFLFGTV
ncbi:hypothetical protein AAUPMC_18404, partial [Pasteurella multocida subsp. multocida str. Anand1_cattle]